LHVVWREGKVNTTISDWVLFSICSCECRCIIRAVCSPHKACSMHYVLNGLCSVRISEPTAIISLYSINWLDFITETESVYCAVRTGSLHTIWIKFCPI